MKVELTTFDHNFFHLAKGNNVILKLADNSLITLDNEHDVESIRESIGPRITGRECWTALPFVFLNKETRDKILASDITAIRIQADESNLDFDIKHKDSVVIKNMISLILNASR